MRLLLCAALLAAGSAHADSEVRNGADFIRLTAKPCADATVSALVTAQGEDPKDYRQAIAEIGGMSFSACWRPMFEREQVFIRYSDGDMGMVPFQMFQPVSTI